MVLVEYIYSLHLELYEELQLKYLNEYGLCSSGHSLSKLKKLGVKEKKKKL